MRIRERQKKRKKCVQSKSRLKGCHLKQECGILKESTFYFFCLWCGDKKIRLFFLPSSRPSRIKVSSMIWTREPVPLLHNLYLQSIQSIYPTLCRRPPTTNAVISWKRKPSIHCHLWSLQPCRVLCTLYHSINFICHQIFLGKCLIL